MRTSASRIGNRRPATSSNCRSCFGRFDAAEGFHPNKVLGNPRDAYTREPPTASSHQPLPVREKHGRKDRAHTKETEVKWLLIPLLIPLTIISTPSQAPLRCRLRMPGDPRCGRTWKYR